jgi:hypothetical protein
MTDTKLKFVLVNTTCGHLVAYANNRSLLQGHKNKLVIYGFTVKIEERDGTDAELLALIDNERCGTCSVDGNLRTVLR